MSPERKGRIDSIAAVILVVAAAALIAFMWWVNSGGAGLAPRLDAPRASSADSTIDR